MITATLRGYLVGPIWWPAGLECWKDLSVDLDSERYRFSKQAERPDLEDMISHIIMREGGDFQSCTIAAAVIILSSTKRVGRDVVKRTRCIPLDKFPSVKDWLHPDPDWCPAYAEDEEDA